MKPTSNYLNAYLTAVNLMVIQHLQKLNRHIYDSSWLTTWITQFQSLNSIWEMIMISKVYYNIFLGDQKFHNKLSF